MKRNRVIFFLFILLFCLCACSSKEDQSVSSEIFESSIVENYNDISGTWTVGGIYYNGELIKFDESGTETLAQLYDSTVVNVTENGEFWLYNVVFYEGKCLKISEKAFLLNVEYAYSLEYIDGKAIKTEEKSISDIAYLVSIVEDNILRFSEIDLETAQVSDEIQLLLCKE